MAGRWVAMRSGLFEGTKDNEFSTAEYVALTHMIYHADAFTGVWEGSAPALVAICGSKLMNLEKAGKVLQSLEERAFIKRLYVQGRYGNYPILIDRYQVSRGDNEGKLLDAQASGWDTDLVYMEEVEQPKSRKLSLAAFAGSAKRAAHRVAQGAAHPSESTPEMNSELNPEHPGAHPPYSTQGIQDTRLDRATDTTPVRKKSKGASLSRQHEEQSRSFVPEADASAVPAVQEQVVSGSVEHTEEEIASLITACYRAAGKKPVINYKNRCDAVEALQGRTFAELLSLLEWAAGDPYWGKQAFPGVDRPVSLLAKKQSLIAKRMGQAQHKSKSPVQLQAGAHAPTPMAPAPPEERLNFGDWVDKRKAAETESGWGRDFFAPTDEEGYAEYLKSFEQSVVADRKLPYRKPIPPFIYDPTTADEDENTSSAVGDWGITL